MRTKLAVSLTMVGLFMSVAVAPVWAHHAFAAEFDGNKPVKFLDATVTKVSLINPHSWIYVDVKMPDGKVENWAIEAGSPNILLRRGITKDSLKVGTKINVDGYQSRDGSHRANGRDLILADGSHLFMGSSDTGAPGDAHLLAQPRGPAE